MAISTAALGRLSRMIAIAMVIVWLAHIIAIALITMELDTSNGPNDGLGVVLVMLLPAYAATALAVLLLALTGLLSGAAALLSRGDRNPKTFGAVVINALTTLPMGFVMYLALLVFFDLMRW